MTRPACPYCADAGFVRAADGGVDACLRCARRAEAEFAFTTLIRPATTRPGPRCVPRWPGSAPQTREVTACPA